MRAFPRRVRWALLLRTLLIQGSWNFGTLIGTGFAFVLLPALRHVYRSDPEALEAALARHSAVFNSHPYLVGVAAGAVARLEADGTDAALLGRFKDALRSSLGALGDQLVWSAWRPAVALLAIGLLLVGAPWWLSVAAFLLVYNALHLWIRTWALNVGLAEGLQVGQALRAAPLQPWTHRVGRVGAVLVGFCLVLAVADAGPRPVALLVAAGAAVLGVALAQRTPVVVWVVLTVAWAVGILIGAFRGPLS